MEFEYHQEPAIESEHEFITLCGLDPRMDCPTDCELNNLMRELFQRHLSRTGTSYPALVEQFRDPSNEERLDGFRHGQSATLRRRGLIESCKNYPQADITQQ